MKLTARQEQALLDAYEHGGSLFQLPGQRRHHPRVLSALVAAGLLTARLSGVDWTLTEQGREALKSVY